MIFKSKAFLFFALVLFVTSCTEQVSKTTQICVLIDVSDERFKDDNFVAENLPKFLKLMNLEKETGGFSGGEIKLSLINEVSDSKSKTVMIKKGKTGLMGENPLNRKDEVEKFYVKLESSFSEILNSANWGTDASKIYQKVTRELLKMKKSDADQKYLIVYSDMLENSQQFSFYGPGWKNRIEKMMSDPESTLQTLPKSGPALPDLSEFEIHIISTRTSENDEKVNLSEQFWNTIFEYQGATVVFSSGLEI